MKRVFAFLAPAFFTVAAIAAPRGEGMDYDHFPPSSVTMQYVKDGEGLAMKGVALPLKLDGKPIGVASFDTMQCRWVGVWTTGPRAERSVVFQTAARDGWLGPDASLLTDWPRWSGLHVSGDQVALEYAVQGTPVQELAAFKRKNGIEWFERDLEVGASKAPLTFMVCDAKDPAPSMREDVAESQEGDTATVALWDSPHGEDLILTWRLVDGAICLEIPPRAQPAHIAVRIWRGPAQNQPDRGAWEEAAGAHEALASFTTGNPLETVTDLRVERDEVKLTFDASLDPAVVSNPGDFEIREDEPKGGSLKISSATLSPDGKTVTLAIPGFRPVTQTLVRAHFKTVAGVCHEINAAPAASGK